jgi:hypothetical protein
MYAVLFYNILTVFLTQHRARSVFSAVADILAVVFSLIIAITQDNVVVLSAIAASFLMLKHA